MKNKSLLLLGTVTLTLATSALADITIDFQDLPSGYTFPADTLTPYDGLYVFTAYGANQTTAAGLQLDSNEAIAFIAPGIIPVAPGTYFTLDSITFTATDVVEVDAVDPYGYTVGNGVVPTGTYTDPLDGAILGGLAVLNDDTGPSTINSITLDIIAAPEPAQWTSGLLLAALGGLGWVARRRRRAI